VRYSPCVARLPGRETLSAVAEFYFVHVLSRAQVHAEAKAPTQLEKENFTCL